MHKNNVHLIPSVWSGSPLLSAHLSHPPVTAIAAAVFVCVPRQIDAGCPVSATV